MKKPKNTEASSEKTTLDLAKLLLSTQPNALEGLIKRNNSVDFNLLAINNGVANQINAHLSAQLINVRNNKDTSHLTHLNNQLNSFSQHSRVMCLIIDNTAKELLLALSERNIHVVVLKGFSLSHQIYEISYLRPKTDIDILINIEDKTVILDVFKGLGYSNPRGWEPTVISNEFSMQKTLGKGVNVLFDVHLKISNSKQVENLLTYDELLNSADKSTLPELNLINKPYALVHAIIHLLHHKSQGDMIKLIWHYDIYLLINKFSAEELTQVKSIIVEKELVAICLVCINLTKEYFTSPQIEAFTQWCKQPAIFARSNQRYNYLLNSAYGIKGLWLTLKSTKGILGKWHIIKETAFPPSAEIYIKYGKDTRWPLSLLYIRRIFTGFFKYISTTKK